MSSPWNLDGKTALVTGASRGIGRAIAEELLGLGARCILVARDRERLHDAISALGDRASGVAADVTTVEGRTAIVDAARGAGPLHVLVHNAGSNVRGPLVSYDDATIERLLALNLTSPLLLSRDLHSLLAEATGASVIHIGSVAGHVALPTGVAYGAVCAANSIGTTPCDVGVDRSVVP